MEAGFSRHLRDHAGRSLRRADLAKERQSSDEHGSNAMFNDMFPMSCVFFALAVILPPLQRKFQGGRCELRIGSAWERPGSAASIACPLIAD
jgi:hypothetical protein